MAGAPSFRGCGFQCTMVLYYIGIVSVKDSFRRYDKRVNGHLRRAIYCQMRRLKTQGALRLGEIADERGPSYAFERFCDFEDTTWKGKKGVFLQRTPHSKSFVKEWFAYYAPLGKLACFELVLGEYVLACLVCYRDGNSMHAMKAAYNKAFSAFSPGNVLFWYVLQDVFSRGDTNTFDFVGALNQKHVYSTNANTL